MLPAKFITASAPLMKRDSQLRLQKKLIHCFARGKGFVVSEPAGALGKESLLVQGSRRAISYRMKMGTAFQ